MPTSWSTPHTARLAASAGLLFAHGAVAAGFDAANNIALYWGQNSYNQAEGELAQQSLATYCANTNVDIIPMAFAVQLTSGEGGQPVINLANSGNNCSVFDRTATLNCPSIGDDITTCQEKYNKTILLSIGGATYSEGGFKTEDDAVKAADLMWNTFGPVQAADLPGNSSAGNSTTSLTRSTSTSLPDYGYNSTTGPLSLRTSTTFGTGATGTGLPGEITPTPGLHANATTTSSGLAETGRDRSSTEATATPAPYGNGTTAAASRTTGANNLTGTGTGPITATLLVNNMTATLILDDESSSNDTATSTSSNAVKSSVPTDVLLPSGSTDRLGAALTTDIITSTDPYLSLTAQSYDEKHTTPSAQAPASNPSRTATYTNDDDIFTTIPVPRSTLTTLQTLTRASGAAVATEGAETLDYADTHPLFRRQSITLRPFGSAGVDGFDLDLESSTTNFPAFANRLRDLMDSAQKVSRTNRKFYLTSAPQCPYPDAAIGPLLNGGVHFDAIFVQFYNNYCGLQSFTPNTTTQSSFNFATWDGWAKNGSANPDVKIFLGVPAGQTAAGSGYGNATTLAPVIEYTRSFKSFGGVMAWDASQAFANAGFLDGVKQALNRSAAPNTTLSAPTTKERVVRRSMRGEWRPRCRGMECMQ